MSACRKRKHVPEVGCGFLEHEKTLCGCLLRITCVFNCVNSRKKHDVLDF